MDLTDYRASPSEQQRTADLVRLMPTSGRHALDIGARDGHFSLLMAERFDDVIALDLTAPSIAHSKIKCHQGNAAEMEFADKTFDFVFCAEVLEHVPTDMLRKVCREIERVANHRILIGVPYKQDIRVGRTTCHSCGKPNPPWGHVNTFDEDFIKELFQSCEVEAMSFVGVNTARTNTLSTLLMDFSGNPYGTYDQEEPCIYCGRHISPPPKRNIAQLVATKLAFFARKASEYTATPRGNWIHIVLRKVNDVKVDDV